MDVIISDILSKGCRDQKTAAMTCQVYQEFIENKKYHNVTYKYNERLNTTYITAKCTKSSPECVFVPISSFDNISLDTMGKYIEIEESKTVYLAILSPDSTLVCYRLSDGLMLPSVLKETKHDRRQVLDSELNKRRDDIKSAAMCSLPLSSIRKF